MGSGGMADVARYFIEFTHSESCGKCVQCRVGLDKSRHFLNKLSHGKASQCDIVALEVLSRMIRDTSLCGLGQSAPSPVLITLRHFRHEFEDHILAHRCRAGVCEDLALSPCENSCPLHMNIPSFLQLLKEDRLDEAFESVNMREVHRFIADSIYNSDRDEDLKSKIVSHRKPPTGKKIGVVGAVPTGIANAYYCALAGHEVSMYDSNPLAGGMLRYALPEYRLPKSVLDKELELIERMGVRFQGNTRVPQDLSLNELDSLYDAVFLAIGTWKENWVYLAGTELQDVYPALPFLEEVSKQEPVELGAKVVVIGGGNAAIDSARTALRMGSKATVIYRRERKDMPAITEETEAAEAEGAEIVFLATPHRIVGDGAGRVQAIEVVKTRLGEYDASGRRRPIPTNDILRFQCDSIILAVGETVDAAFTRASGLKIKENASIEVDRYTLETSRSKFYAGASNVSNVMGYGKKAARNIDERLMGVHRGEALLPHFEYDQ